MDALKRIDKILAVAQERVQEEVCALLGVQFVLSGALNVPITKQEFFDSLGDKHILAKLDITGEVEGLGCLVLSIKDAIRLGGILIMLPSAELEEVIRRAEYSEEIEDSFGEIANIIAGSYSKSFEEMYPGSCRFIRKEQEVVVPAKVEISSDEPIPDQLYYQVTCTMKIGDRQMGDFFMLMPAEPFGLNGEETAPQVAADESTGWPATEKDSDVAEEAVPEAVAEPAVESPAPPSKPAGPKIDVKKHKKRIDKLLENCRAKLTDEVGGLLGVEVNFASLENRLISKEAFFFEEAEGKQVVANMDVVGDFQDKSYLFVSLKSAIHIGGVLIMLPPAELEAVVSEEDFSEDAKDAFGEVANIISGVYTSVFEEQYSQKIRFVKTDIDQVVPMKVDIGADGPVPDQSYYMSSMSMLIAGKDLGKVRMLFPLDVLGLASLGQPETVETAGGDAALRQPETGGREQSAPLQPSEAPELAGSEASASFAVEAPKKKIDVAKHRKRVDRILQECEKKMQDEVGALLGVEVKLEELNNRLIGKEEFFFEEAEGKQVIANLDVVGELEDKSYLFVGLKDAIHIGGVLIMLPPSELEVVVSEEDFSEDAKDAYGEIANIISGVYTAVFEEHYTKKIRFVKTDLQQVIPMKVDTESDDPVPNQDYYMSSMSLSIDGKRLGKVRLLFPAQILDLDQLGQESVADEQVGQSPQAKSVQAEQGQVEEKRGVATLVGSGAPADILLISDDEQEAVKIVEVIETKGFSVRKVSFKDNISKHIPGELKAVYIVMREVNEQAFGVAIKVSSSSSLPLIAAGPGWTRSKVIKAVKYGVNDILLTPATREDIEENVENNLVELAA